VAPSGGGAPRLLAAFELPPAAYCHVVGAELRVAGTGGDASRAYRAGSPWDSDVDADGLPGTVGSPAYAQSAPGGLRFDVTGQLGAAYRYGDDGLLLRGLDSPAEARLELEVELG
jgi:hypothetical protein